MSTIPHLANISNISRLGSKGGLVPSESFVLQATWGSNSNPADGSTIYMGQTRRSGVSIDANSYRIRIPKKCILKKCFLSSRVTTAGSAEQSTISIVVNGATEYVVTSTFQCDTALINVASNTNLNIPLNKGDYICIKWVTPTRVTNPVSVGLNATLRFDGVLPVGVGSYVLQGGDGTITGVAGQTYYLYDTDFATTNATQARIYVPSSGILTRADIYSRVGSTLGSNEQFTIAVRKNNTTDYNITTTATRSATNNSFSNNAMSVPLSEGDYISIKVIGPAWVTPPTGVVNRFSFLIQRS